MEDNTIAEIDALQHIQTALNTLNNIHKKDTEIISAIRDLKNAKYRVAEILRFDTIKNR